MGQSARGSEGLRPGAPTIMQLDHFADAIRHGADFIGEIGRGSSERQHVSEEKRRKGRRIVGGRTLLNSRARASTRILFYSSG